MGIFKRIIKKKWLFKEQIYCFDKYILLLFANFYNIKHLKNINIYIYAYFYNNY